MKDLHTAKMVPDYLRDGRYEYLSGVLDQEPPWILMKLIRLLSSRVVIDDHVVEKLRDISTRCPIVYAMKYRSMYDLEFLRMRFAALRLPAPCFVFGMSSGFSGSFRKWLKVWRNKFMSLIPDAGASVPLEENVAREIMELGGAGVMFLVDEKTSRKRYVHPALDPLRMLMDLQGSMAGSIAVVPLVILYDRTQRRTIRPLWESFLGDPDQPGILKRLLIAVRKWTVPELLVGEPVYLIAEFEEFGSEKEWEEAPFEVRTKLVAAINARIRVNRGPERMSRTEIKELVLQDPKVQTAVREAVSLESTGEETVRKKAESYVDEMAGDQRVQVHHFLYYVLKWTFSQIFNGVDIRETDFQILKEKNQKGSLIYVSCHKSHVDYLVIGFLSFINQMAIPYMAAGKNLSFWPVGPILRNAGAFFIRRSFKNLGLFTGLYTSVFEAYLKVLVKENVNINFYIEGGRSRTGKLLPPRVGMLSSLVQAVGDGAVSDMTFVPTFVGYDQVPEENSYLRELSGREKQKETFRSLLRSREVLKKRFGKAYIRFHSPLSYRQFCDRWRAEIGNDKQDLSSNRKMLQDFAYHLMAGIVRSGVVTPIDLVAAGLMCTSKNRVSKRTLLESVRCLSDSLRGADIEFAASLEQLETVVETSLGLFRIRGFLDVDAELDSNGQASYIINESGRIHLDFYRNSLINYLWPAALVATVFLADDSRTDCSYDRIYERFGIFKQLLVKEVICDPLVGDKELVDGIVRFYVEQGWVNEDLKPANTEALEYLSGVVRDLLSVYYLALVASDTIDKEGIVQKEFARTMVKTARDMLGENKDTAIPPVTSLTVDNALMRFSEMGVFQYRPGRKLLTGVVDPLKRDQLREYLSDALRFG